MASEVTLQDFKDAMASLERKHEEYDNKKFIIYTEAEYDYLEKECGDNCGWDRNKVIVLRGYSKLSVL
jgi:hypothetical protein